MWSLGGTCDAASRHKFDRYLRDSLEHLGYPREPHEVCVRPAPAPDPNPNPNPDPEG